MTNFDTISQYLYDQSGEAVADIWDKRTILDIDNMMTLGLPAKEYDGKVGETFTDHLDDEHRIRLMGQVLNYYVRDDAHYLTDEQIAIRDGLVSIIEDYDDQLIDNAPS